MKETTTDRIVRLVKGDPSITAAELQRLTGVSRQRVHQILKKAGFKAAPPPAIPRADRPRRGPSSRVHKSPPPPEARLTPSCGPVKLSTSAVGAVSELLVAADLKARGWSVFFPLFRARCDLIAASYDATILKRFEVRSGRLRGDGKYTFQRTDFDMCDHYAIVLAGEPVVYLPPLEDAPPKPRLAPPIARWVELPPDE